MKKFKFMPKLIAAESREPAIISNLLAFHEDVRLVFKGGEMEFPFHSILFDGELNLPIAEAVLAVRLFFMAGELAGGDGAGAVREF